MRRPRATVVLTLLAPVGLLGLAACSSTDSAESRVAVLGESRPVASAPMLGAGDSLGRGVHEVILARTSGGATYATVTDNDRP